MKPGQHPTVLFVDDEERILRTLTILFRSSCRVLATSDPAQALAWVRPHELRGYAMPPADVVLVERLIERDAV